MRRATHVACMGEQALTRQFLEWLETEPRTYRDVMDAWRTHCPRHMIWEDALDQGLVAFDGDRVVLSAEGRLVLAAQEA